MFNKKTEAEHANVKHYANLLRTLVLEGGKLARSMKAEASVEEKADRSLVTAADLAVTKRVKERLDAILKQENHILIDEESLKDLPPVSKALAHDYQWVLDPIDGTAPYSSGLPFWAVSLGLMRKGEPWLGAVYLPDLDELYWTDGTGNVMHQKGATGAAEAKKVILNNAPVFDNTPYFVEWLKLKEGFEFKGYNIRSGACVVGGILSMTTNTIGFLANANLWDHAAIMAIGKTLGFEMRKILGNEIFEKFDDNFLDERYHLNGPIMMAKPENVALLRSKILK